ncbi:hypothetical protein C7974DRAFT_409715 [Boeremia exigua]|uniref:uncharacterized protein n=1 Tax=Boeremia exigua TaxID=749465 RepID=UPI001E8E8E58|nr:uncharacterized protein C7974DRAFT_409715 [Boeremia exigua]KAH6643236.1 hypothetical protein C7974DRAFT_409715 [Boeremia exigua]
MAEIVLIDFAKHVTRAIDYLVLMVIQRSTPSPSLTSFSTARTAAARDSLREHTTCVALLVSHDADPALFETWVNEGLLFASFLPFDVVFCSVVEMGHVNDLQSLRALVDALKSVSHRSGYAAGAKQLQIFRALYKVAVVHKVRGGLDLPSTTVSDETLHGSLAPPGRS